MVSRDYGLRCDLPIVFDANKQASLLFEVVLYISHRINHDAQLRTNKH